MFSCVHASIPHSLCSSPCSSSSPTLLVLLIQKYLLLLQHLCPRFSALDSTIECRNSMKVICVGLQVCRCVDIEIDVQRAASCTFRLAIAERWFNQHKDAMDALHLRLAVFLCELEQWKTGISGSKDYIDNINATVFIIDLLDIVCHRIIQQNRIEYKKF